MDDAWDLEASELSEGKEQSNEDDDDVNYNNTTTTYEGHKVHH